ncbi:MAG: peptidoglycan DD-metalloendopeptidase family protein [Hymenobacteraceae bacterium]|nr:peptidoglycan DD-metalloendopeptidase family protein [Hymenobacteraceae bacterium]MDX5395740.1 peptidoglycan DD-metalloendopeptidase family protein [Hymenobacteraceae bacterium]MDX5443143.1 peptidoglycan DD-metalloendopeptidase family protein [Hymenobacteraceae bacterium]MDX5511794.1 peptidoglycan DD-metalloendopeptidase family protein [Hymenobacteraceae bacterium]
MRKLLIGLAGCLLLSMVLYFTGALDKKNTNQPQELVKTDKDRTTPAAPVVFGIPTDTLEIVEDKIKSGENMSELLANYNLSQAVVHELSQKSRKIFNLRNIRANKPYTLLCSTDSARTARYFIYEPSALEYVVFELFDSLKVQKYTREIEVVEQELAGTIHSNLFEAMVEAGAKPALVDHFADIYAWKVNFGAIQPGDAFKIIFEEKRVGDKVVGYGDIIGASFIHNGNTYYAINYSSDKTNGFYDENGKSLKKAFLKEPLEYTRISSRFSKNRFHPVQKRYKAHLGTDFAAPRGTPIRSVGEGVVVAAGYTRGNGNYVKIKHNNTYTTQYLHMSKFARGIRKGKRVKQGQTIGYVGSTGLATGPHLCYRFWKNGRQVDALKQKLPAAKSISVTELAQYKEKSEAIKQRLDKLQPTQPLLANSKNKAQPNT